MDIQVTPIQAFQHFINSIDGPIPKDVQEAKYAMEGKRRYGLGDKRIKSILEKYAPDRYEFRGVVIIHE